MTVGLIADPGLSTKIAEALSADLPAEFARQISDQVDWKLEVCSRALPLDDDGNIEVWKRSSEVKRDQQWDLLICLTELTRRVGTRLLVSDTWTSHGAALISLPALGPVRLRRRVREALVYVVRAMYADQDTGPRRPPSSLADPTRRELTTDDEGTSSRVELRPRRGRPRLLLGMVRVNRPWRLIPSLSSALAAAVATAAFGVFYYSIWNMADAMSAVRLATVSLIAVSAMMLWLILYNGLWARPQNLDDRKNAALYNSATVLTLVVGVTIMYALLFVAVLLGALVVIPWGYLESRLGHPATLLDYVELALLASSLGTFAGALGSSFESDHAVRNATFAKREQERHARTRT
ncbi:hypothetical protein [Mycobacterium sp. SMC-4]|uniref:hypothetical protein n=1 Tax=Mycobacterium sp. SMC-4 TaxID=2857059 RepID=UPI003D069250